MEKLLSALEVADVLGVPITTLYVWRNRQQGPDALRVGRHLRYRATEVERWLGTRGRAV